MATPTSPTNMNMPGPITIHSSSTTGSVSKRHPLHPEDVQFSPAWLALSGLGAAGAAAIVRRFGWRGALIVGLAGALAGGYSIVVEPRRPELKRIDLRFPELPPELDGMRIGQISDSHLGMPFAARNLRWALEHMRREQPELLVFTGDFTHKEAALPQVPGLFANVSAPLGVYAVPGNHDYWDGVGALKQLLSQLGIEMLLNEHRRLEWRGGEFWIIGTDDIWDGTPDLEAALHHVPLDAFTVLLAHTPYEAPLAAKLGINLQLSGHTHGGHMMLPLLGPLAKPRYTGRFLGGMFHIGPTTLYVSRGIGGAPLRLLARPEATIFTLRKAR